MSSEHSKFGLCYRRLRRFEIIRTRWRGKMKNSLGIAALTVISATLLAAISAHAQTTSLNSGSLGAAGNGTNAAGVLVQSPGAVGPGGGVAAYYSGGSVATPVNTTVPFNPALN